jgi:hypothetical protein
MLITWISLLLRNWFPRLLNFYLLLWVSLLRNTAMTFLALIIVWTGHICSFPACTKKGCKVACGVLLQTKREIRMSYPPMIHAIWSPELQFVNRLTKGKAGLVERVPVGNHLFIALCFHYKLRQSGCSRSSWIRSCVTGLAFNDSLSKKSGSSTKLKFTFMGGFKCQTFITYI